MATYTKIKVKVNGNVKFTDVGGVSTVTKQIPFTSKGKVKPFNLTAYKPRTAQFTDGSAAKQSEILDMLISPGIVKGIKGIDGIRYVVDCFKSFVEGSYKYQFGSLMVSLDQSNKFVRAIINEPFVEDLEKSQNPLFRQSPSFPFDFQYLRTGGNNNYSTKFLTKFSSGAEMCFFYGGGYVKGTKMTPPAAKASNLFYLKQRPYDVLANETGYIDGIDGLEVNPDDDERAAMEAFGWNPTVKLGSDFTIYGNLTGQKSRTGLQQIHNSELLAYIKETLYNNSKGEAFRKGTYNNYLSTQVSVQNFMDGLALASAVEPNPIVTCDASNNTSEISGQKMKLVKVVYTNINALEKTVFELELH